MSGNGQSALFSTTGMRLSESGVVSLTPGLGTSFLVHVGRRASNIVLNPRGDEQTMAVVLAQPAPGEQQLMELEVRPGLPTLALVRRPPEPTAVCSFAAACAHSVTECPTWTSVRSACDPRVETASPPTLRWGLQPACTPGAGVAVGAAHQDGEASEQAARGAHGVPRAVALPACGLR